MSWQWQFGLLLAFVTIWDYSSARILGYLDTASGEDARRNNRLRKIVIVCSILMNLGILGYFKYTDFFIASFVDLINTIAPGTFSPGDRSSLLLNLILPLGISFFTFHSMNYTIDVYRRVYPSEKSLLRFALYVSFFPVLLAGPIITAREFLPQLRRMPVMDLHRMKIAARWFLLGYFKKTVIADNIGPIVDIIYRNSSAYGAAGHWLGAYGFWAQAYCDFSGYSDMAWGTAMFLGYNLPENFRLPYLSLSVTEHWQRWHMSLIKWIRDYLYIPLGGNRVSFFRHKLNIFLTMFLAGLWHGANWTFVVWGSIHGTILAVESAYRELKEKYRKKRGEFIVQNAASEKSIRAIPAVVFAFLATTFCNVYFGTMFRSQSIGESWMILKRMLGFDSPASAPLQPAMYRPVIFAVLTIYVGHLLGYWIFEKKSWKWNPPVWLELAVLPIVILVLIQLGATDVAPFIYFVF